MTDLGPWILHYYRFYLTYYQDEDLAAVTTADHINALLALEATYEQEPV